MECAPHNIPQGFVCGIEMAHPDWKLRDGFENGLKRILTIHQVQMKHSTPRLSVLRNQLDGVRSEQHYKWVYM